MKATSTESSKEHQSQPSRSAPGAGNAAGKQAAVAPGVKGTSKQAQQSSSSRQQDADRTRTAPKMQKDAKAEAGNPPQAR
jgi:hypothetical protein